MTYQLNKQDCISARLTATTFRVLAASMLAIGIAGCGHRFDTEAPASFVAPQKTVEQAHPIEVEKAHTNLTLAVPTSANGLNVYQQERVRHFIGQWRSGGTGKIAVSGNSRPALANLRDLLIQAGVPIGAVDVGRFDGDKPGVKLSFARYIAEGPKCGKWADNLAEDKENTNYGNFGCSTQHNFAAMIDNPRDLVVPRDQTDWSDGDRRDFIFRHWFEGQKTTGETSVVDTKGTVSAVATK